MNNIRNFSIIAHIDHGKSTLADRILEYTGAVSEREKRDQILDSMELEQEKGITIKSQAVHLKYISKDGEEYQFNLIDTPGHSDFGNEVSRSLKACEGALLVVDATQGVEAQTLANVYLALENNLEIIPVINKVDLPNADVERVKREIEDTIGIDASDAISVSAKTGLGIEELLEAMVKRIPAPKENYKESRALVFDSYFDEFRGVVTFVRVMSGSLKKRDKILFMATGAKAELLDLGVKTPKMTSVDELKAGSVGYLISGIKSIEDTRVGDTVTLFNNPAKEPLDGYKEVKPTVFAGIYPINNDDFPALREAIDKIKLNDPSLVYEADSSGALGFGFRVGFLGLLHMEIIVERLRREYDLSLISSAPSVLYRVDLKNGKQIEVSNPADMPSVQEKDAIYEPIASTTIFAPKEYIGDVMQLCNKKRGIFKDMIYSGSRVVISYDMPITEIILDFHDKLKSSTKGYASFEYEFSRYEASDLVKVDILLNGERVDALSIITHRINAYYKGRELVDKLKEFIPRHMFTIPIQAAIGNKIIARETINAKRKDVLSKCYGGDITRKKKLLAKQKEGKSRMKAVGRVLIPQEAFTSILKLG